MDIENDRKILNLFNENYKNNVYDYITYYIKKSVFQDETAENEGKLF